MQGAITWIYIDQDIRHYITWFGHNELSPKADLRILLGSLTGLLDGIRCETPKIRDLVSLASPPNF